MIMAIFFSPRDEYITHFYVPKQVFKRSEKWRMHESLLFRKGTCLVFHFSLTKNVKNQSFYVKTSYFL